ncbi:DNA helicase mcm9 [Chamberlinius hualienensis]
MFNGTMEQLFDDKLIQYFVEQHGDDLKNVLLSADVEKHYSIVIEAPLLFDVCIELSDHLLQNPVKVLAQLDEMLVKAQKLILDSSASSQNEMRFKEQIHTRIAGLSLFPQLNRNVIPKSSDLDLFISISGIIVRASLVQLIQQEKSFICNSCKHRFIIQNDFRQFNRIKGRGGGGGGGVECPNPIGCSSNKFTTNKLEGREQWRDYQEVKIQENVQVLSTRVIPRTILVILENDLVDSCKPGDDVTIVGIMCRRWRSSAENTKCHVQHVIIANHVEVNNQKSHIRMTTDTEEHFADFWSKFKNCPLKGRDEIVQSLCPQIYGLYPVKLAVALVLLGGVPKTDEVGTRIRGESHMLLIGDPGTGKSEFLKYATKISSRSMLTTGIGSTSAGLTVSAVKDSGQWHLEAGALVLADGGLCCIDEFSGIKEHDKSSILEAMEQQTISVAKAGLVCKMNTRCTILAATNPKGRYDSNLSANINVAISTPLLSRFDLIYLLLDEKSEDWDQRVSNYVLEGKTINVVPHAMNMNRMKTYFNHVKQLKPKMSSITNRILQQYYLLHRKSDDQKAIRTTVRLFESLIRLSEAHAKLMFRSEVLAMDAIASIIVMEYSLGSLKLVDLESVMHTNFPHDPDQLYATQAEAILSKLGLDDVMMTDESLLSEEQSIIDGTVINDETTISHISSSSTQEKTQNFTTLFDETTNNKKIFETRKSTKTSVSLRTMKKLENFAFKDDKDVKDSTKVVNKDLLTDLHKSPEVNQQNLSAVDQICQLNDEDLTLDWL